MRGMGQRNNHTGILALIFRLQVSGNYKKCLGKRLCFFSIPKDIINLGVKIIVEMLRQYLS